jgi:hypothetical protein
MTSAAMIDQLLNYFDQISATDADNATRRVMVLEWLQEVVDEFCHERPWRWLYTTTTVTVPDGQGYIALPSDFQEFGPYGGVYDSQGRNLLELSPQAIQDYRTSVSTGIAFPGGFAVFMADNGVQRFQIPENSGAQTFTIWYKKTPPTCADSTNANTNGLNYIPTQYHYSVILAGLKAKAARSKADARAPELEMMFQRGKDRAAVLERGRRSSTRRMPRAVSSW